MELGNSVVKTPEAESETPTRIQPPFTNGVLKRHAPLQLHHHPVVVTYKECLKNHAATIGGHAIDGCGEFMPSPNSNPAEPTTLKCAACGCHRNFHRRDPDETPHPLLPPSNSVPALEYQPHHRHHPPPPRRGNSEGSPNNSPSPPPISSSYAPHMLLALSHGLSAMPPDAIPPGNAASTLPASNSGNRKRFRTKFTQNQKDKMLELADKVGWKMQKKDEDAINEGCNEIGVDRSVFKVWMHNNKNTVLKKDPPPPPPLPLHLSTPPSSSANRNGVNYGDIGADVFREPKESFNSDNINQHRDDSGGDTVGTNGGSSST